MRDPEKENWDEEKEREQEEANGGMDVEMVEAKAHAPPGRTEPQARDSCVL